MFIKAICKDSKKVKIIRNYEIIQMQYISVFFDITTVADFRRRNANVRRTQEVCYVNYTFFGSPLGKVKLPNFIIVGYL